MLKMNEDQFFLELKKRGSKNHATKGVTKKSGGGTHKKGWIDQFINRNRRNYNFDANLLEIL